MVRTIANGVVSNFLGNAPDWYKLTIIFFLILNPILVFAASPVIAGWALIFEFIFTLAMALKCYPLQPGGLLALEAVFIGLTSPATVYHEVEGGLPVILLLIFMVAGIFFLKDLLLFIFTKFLLNVRNKIVISLLFTFLGAILSAFLDALTVTAVVITVSVGFYSVYHRAASGKKPEDDHNFSDDGEVRDLHRADLEQFRAFLRSLVMHAAVGTALGGVCTLVGEPQNLLIGHHAGWTFMEFFYRMMPVSLPVLAAGLITTALLEKFRLFGFGALIPDAVRQVLVDFDTVETGKRTGKDKATLVAQGVIAIWLVFGLLFHLAAVGLVGLSVIVLATVFTGIIEENRIGRAFEEALPFTALLVVFFSIVAVINDQQLFVPFIDWVLKLDGHMQVVAFYLANGVLSSISDNVFVASVYIGEVEKALRLHMITRDQFDLLAIAINTGTNIPSVATPNGQAAFLFLLTSALAPLIRLSYMRMVIMAFPYTVVMTLTGLAAVTFLLEPATASLYNTGLIPHHLASQVVSLHVP